MLKSSVPLLETLKFDLTAELISFFFKKLKPCRRYIRLTRVTVDFSIEVAIGKISLSNAIIQLSTSSIELLECLIVL